MDDYLDVSIMETPEGICRGSFCRRESVWSTQSLPLERVEVVRNDENPRMRVLQLIQCISANDCNQRNIRGTTLASGL